MSVNLVSVALQYLTPDVIARIASALGLDRSMTGKAVAALVPGLLRSFTNVAATPEGARKLSGVIGQQTPGIFDSLPTAIGGAGQQSIVDSGLGALSSLLGSAGVPALAGALGKYAGIGQGPSTSLIGLLAPAVLGVVGKEQKAHGLDAAGLANLLAGQKANINAALPSGFADALSASGLPALSTPSTSVPAAKAAPSWLPGALALLALAALAWWLFGNRPADVGDQTRTTAEQPAETLTVDGVDLRSTTQTTLDSLKSALQGISDEASAQAAVPRLQTTATDLDRVRGLSTKLPTTGKSALAALVTAARPSIEDLFAKVLALPGVEAVARPIIDQLRAKLDELAKA